MDKIQIIKNIFKKNNILIFLSIILVSSFMPLFLYFNNVSEARIVEVLPSILLFSSISFIVYFILYFLMKNIYSSLVGTYLGILFVENYIYVEKLFNILFPDLLYWHIILISFIVISHGIYILYKLLSRTVLEIIVQAITLTFSGLLLLNLIIATPVLFNKVSLSSSPVVEDFVVSDSSNPNIYYLIVDEYSNTDMMYKYYDYDNSWFDQDLKELGFTVSDNTSNYTTDTSTIVTNFMNYDYVVNGKVPKEEKEVIRHDNSLYKLLSEYNYNIKGIGSSEYVGLESLTSNNDAESTTIEGTTFNELIFKQSIFYPFIKVDNNEDRAIVLNAFDYLEDENNFIAMQNIFTIMYLISPHQPFVFDSEGGEVSPHNIHNANDLEYYREQHEYISKRLISAVKSIQANDPEAIIIIQSDHGARFMAEMTYDDKTKTLNALYFPGIDTSYIEDKDGVNSIRFVLNNLFDLELKELEYEGE